MKITRDKSKDVDTYRVESDSGKVYHITYAGSDDGDPDYISLFHCDCPAGDRGRDCKHMAAFLAILRENWVNTCHGCGTEIDMMYPDLGDSPLCDACGRHSVEPA